MNNFGQATALEPEPNSLDMSEATCIDAPSATRKTVADVSKTPYKWVCLIEKRVAGSSAPSYGTGLLVSPKHVLTAAHVIWARDQKIERVSVRPGAAALWSLNEFSGRNRWVLGEYRRTRASHADLGVIELQKEVSFKPGRGLNLRYFGDPGPTKLAEAMGLKPPLNRLGVPSDLTDLQIVNRKITTIGYPGDRRQSFEAMAEIEGVVRAIDRKNGSATVAIDACTGQSGSPVFLDHNNDRWLIGVVSSIDTRFSHAYVAVLNPVRVNALFLAILEPPFTGPLPALDRG